MQSSVPEIDVHELDRRLKSGEQFILLDVREPWELMRARIPDDRLQTAPLSRLSHQGLAALPEPARDPQASIMVICHHGVRSAQVTGWLAAQGWKQVYSVRGGMADYASQVDPRVGSY